jgi:hypothetical protein
MSAPDDRDRPLPVRTAGAAAPPSELVCRYDPVRGLLIIDLRGPVTLRQLTDGLEPKGEFERCESILWNVTDADLTGLSLEQLRTIVTRVLSDPWAPRRWALLAGLTPSLAVAAALVSLAEERSAVGRVGAFVDRETALEWLGIRENPTNPAPADDVAPVSSRRDREPQP